jgi:L-asparaginase
MSLPLVSLLATGGTIAGASGDTTATTGYQAAALGVEQLVRAVPAIQQVARIRARQIAAINSKDADAGFWQLLGRAVQAELDDPEVRAVVVTHGTDTLEESAAWLHWTLKSPKPVVMTAAMRPATALSADGPLNLLDAVRTASHPRASGRGVMAVLNHGIWSAAGLTKRNTQRPDAFTSANGGPMGLIQDGVVSWLAQPDAPHTLDTPFTVDSVAAPVEIVAGYAGISPALLDAVAATGARGLVWAGTGNGSMSVAVEQTCARLVAGGMAVVRASRCGSGQIMHNGDCNDDRQGFISAGTLTPWQARVLLSLGLGQGLDRTALQALFSRY